MSVADRLGRLLFIVPYVASRGGVTVRELAEKLQTKASQIQSDIELLAMVGQPPLTPDHLIDLYIEDDVVYVELDQSLTRPLRLTHEEARALVLGAKLVGNLGGLGGELDQLLERITQLLPAADREAVRATSERVLMDDEGGHSDHSTMLRQAITEHQRIDIEYYSQSSDALKNYLLEPLALLTHSGFDYLVAIDVGDELLEKLFRLDRLGSVRLRSEKFVAPEHVDLERFRLPRLYFGRGSDSAQIRFDPEVAHRVAERFPAHDVVARDDGGIDVYVQTSSAAFLARWTLDYGTSAEVIAPDTARDYFRELCACALEAYSRPHLSKQD